MVYKETKMLEEPKIRIAVYYRELPVALTSFVQNDGNMSISKDGVKQGVGHSCPRATVTISKIHPAKDKERLQEILKLLDELESNNQIVGHSIRKISN
jgi:hypothetical protein